MFDLLVFYRLSIFCMLSILILLLPLLISPYDSIVVVFLKANLLYMFWLVEPLSLLLSR